MLLIQSKLFLILFYLSLTLIIAKRKIFQLLKCDDVIVAGVDVVCYSLMMRFVWTLWRLSVIARGMHCFVSDNNETLTNRSSH